MKIPRQRANFRRTAHFPCPRSKEYPKMHSNFRTNSIPRETSPPPRREPRYRPRRRPNNLPPVSLSNNLPPPHPLPRLLHRTYHPRRQAHHLRQHPLPATAYVSWNPQSPRLPLQKRARNHPDPCQHSHPLRVTRAPEKAISLKQDRPSSGEISPTGGALPWQQKRLPSDVIKRPWLMPSDPAGTTM